MTPSPSLTWSVLADISRGRLRTTIPDIDTAAHPIIDLLTNVLALAQCQFKTALTPHSVQAHIEVRPSLPEGVISDAYDLIVEAVTDRARSTAWGKQLPIGQHIDQAGFLPFVIDLLKAGVPHDSIRDMARLVSMAIKTLNAAFQALGDTHLHAVLSRDLPERARRWKDEPKSLNPTIIWALATHLSGDPQRPDIIIRRVQALQLYAAVSNILTERPITDAIDDGLPLNPILAKRLDISETELRSLRGAREQERMFTSFGPDFVTAVRELKVHSVPLQEWPGNGKPDQPQAWLNTPWLTLREPQLLRPDRFDPQDDAMRDAIGAFRDDILCPLVIDRARTRFPQMPRRIRDFLYDLRFPSSTLLESAERKEFLTAVRTALVGSRGSKSFAEAVSIWHRRAASIAAVRHEHRAEKRGWPAICEPWHSVNGIDVIVPLTSAAELVEEGNALDHCVGSYYDPCRRGEKQILSLRRNGAHAATIELNLSGDEKDLSMQVGQFRTWRNARPDQASHDALKNFLAAINRGEHRLQRKTLIAHRKAMCDVWDGSWSTRRLSLDHARSVFPLYLSLLPRGTPGDFDQWRAAGDLDASIDQLLIAMAGAEPEAIFDYIPW
ncbi:PcfJ domain-containing protein [Mesorhizobium denitrificans]|uniref:Uncharacterized protein n=1 Tax=Mesorhizobium denitrificans TaxID=2294114 RepID=A0A371X6A5_9HYPH|nr:PcfJ domain-containing protein [Mesorhizobium denitrificans]RFC64750.1 hypothetical protein DY251_18460 [Mesorhizobium denitrificans]